MVFCAFLIKYTSSQKCLQYEKVDYLWNSAYALFIYAKATSTA